MKQMYKRRGKMCERMDLMCKRIFSDLPVKQKILFKFKILHGQILFFLISSVIINSFFFV